MWLMPCSRRSSKVRSASALETLPRAAAPKITRLDSCPVAPKRARSIMPLGYGFDRLLHPPGQLLRRLAGARVDRAGEGDLGPRAAVEAAALGHDQRATLDVDRHDRGVGGQRELGDAGAVGLRPGAARPLRVERDVAALAQVWGGRRQAGALAPAAVEGERVDPEPAGE